MPNDTRPQQGQSFEVSENLTALVGLEVLFKAFAATADGRRALHEAMDQRLDDIETLSRCGVDPGPSRHVAAMLREMIQRVAPLAAEVAEAA
jgi:hypothetical protein